MKNFAVITSALAADIREAVARARSMEFSGVACDALSLPDLSQTGKRDFRHMLSSNALALSALRVHLVPHGLNDSAQIDRILTKLSEIAQLSRELGATCLSIDLGPLPALDNAILALAEIADRHGVRLALASSLSSYDTLDKVLKLAKSPWLGVDLDPAALLRENWNPTQVVHVRARDAFVGEAHRSKPVEIGKGSVNWLELLATLDAASYRGWFTIDTTELPDSAGAAQRGLKFLRSLR